MSFFGDFVGGAATAGAGIIGDQIKSQQEFDTRSKLAVQESELAIARAKMLDEFKRTQSAQDGAAIDSGAATAGNQRIADQMNAANGSSLTASNVSEMALTPDVRAKLGIVGRTRAEEYDDKASTAERLGLDGKAKEIRGQQDLERQRTRDDKRDEADIARDTTNNKRIDQQNEINNRRLDQEAEFRKEDAKIRNRLAGAAEARANRADKRAEGQMDKAELQSTRQSLTSVLTDIGKQQDRIEGLMATSMDPEQKQVYQKQLARLDGNRDVARERLNELAGVAKTEAAPVSKPTPPQAALDMLAKNPDSRAQFEAKYGPAPARQSAPEPAKAKPVPLTAANLRILSSAGNTAFGGSRFNVELPGGTTQIMSRSELEAAGYKFMN